VPKFVKCARHPRGRRMTALTKDHPRWPLSLTGLRRGRTMPGGRETRGGQRSRLDSWPPELFFPEYFRVINTSNSRTPSEFHKTFIDILTLWPSCLFACFSLHFSPDLTFSHAPFPPIGSLPLHPFRLLTTHYLPGLAG